MTQSKSTNAKVRKIPMTELQISARTGNPTSTLYVLDTNVLMHDPTSLFRFKEHDIYLPMITLEELDDHKKGMTEVARNARQVGRELDALTARMNLVVAPAVCNLPLNATGHREATGKLYFQTDLPNVSLPIGLPSGKADNQILGVVHALRDREPDRRVVLVSKDINMRVKARALGLLAEDYENDKVLGDTDVLYTGVLALPPKFWGSPDATDSWRTSDGRTRYRIRDKSRSNMLRNQFVHHLSSDTPFFGRVCEISSDSCVIEELENYWVNKKSAMGIHARNHEQNFGLNLLMDPDVDFVTLLGKAGSGKTLMALAAGIAQVALDGRYSDIIITRVTVPAGEDIGFLPGNEEEKMGPWMGAFDDNLEVINSNGRVHLDRYRPKQNRGTTSPPQKDLREHIKFKSMSFMRGRTFLNKFVIVDEAQNLTPQWAKMLITRAGPGTKMVFLGNLAQIDTPYLTEGSSGLTHVVDRFKGWENGGHITLLQCERSRLAGHAEDVL